jgi:hypothetical protein
MKIKSIIVDDEKHGHENLAGFLRQYCPDVDLQTKALSGFEPLRAFHFKVIVAKTYSKPPKFSICVF